MMHPLPPEADTPAMDARRVFSLVGLSVLALTAGMNLAALLWSALVGWLLPQHADAAWMPWVSSLLPLYGVGLPCMLLTLRVLPAAPHNATYPTPDGLAEKPRLGVFEWLMLLALALGLMNAGGMVGNLLMEGLSALTGYDYQSSLAQAVSASSPWITALAVCVCAPIGEEFIFRKLLIDRTRRFGDTPAILLSGLIFALIHGNLFQFFYAFLVGAILAYVYTRTGKLWPSVVMHALINLMGGVVVPELSALLPADLAGLTAGQTALAAALLAWQYGTILLAGVLLPILWKRRALSRGEMPDGQSPLPDAFGNLGMGACLITLLALLTVNLLPL